MSILKEKAQVIMLPKLNGTLFINRHDKIFINNDYKDGSTYELYIVSDEEIKEGDWFYTEEKYCESNINKCDNINIRNLISGEVIDINDFEDTKKIIANTDTSIFIEDLNNPYDPRSKTGVEPYNLPQPSQRFIEKYIKEYNKGNVITDILVEYETFQDRKAFNKLLKEMEPEDLPNCVFSKILKVSEDNNITIHPIKNNWNREEVKELCRKAFKAGDKFREYLDRHIIGTNQNIPDTKTILNTMSENNWIKQNL